MRQLLLSVLLLASLAAVPAGAAPPVAVGADFHSLDLFPFIEIARDPAAAWSFEQATQQPFSVPPHKKLGYLPGVVWARFSIVNTDGFDRSLYLDAGENHLQRAQLYAIERGGAAVVTATYGGALPFAERPVKTRNVVFPLVVRAGATVDIYLRYEAYYQSNVAPVLYGEAALQEQIRGENILTFGFYSAVLALLIYNLLLAMATREATALAFVGFVWVWGIFISTWDGFVYQWWPYALGLVYHPRYLYVMVALAVLSMTVFTIHYLRLRDHSRRFLYPQYLLLALGATMLGLAGILPLPLLRELTVALFALMFITDGCTGYLISRRNNIYARFYTLGFLTMFASVLLSLRGVYMPQTGYAEVEIWARLSFLLPIGLFSVGLGYRMNELKALATESHLRAAAAQAEAEFKSRFLVTMSHEIRTPLNGVVGMIDLLQETQLSTVQRGYVDVINSSGKALLGVISDVLDFSKLERGKCALEVIGFNLERLIDECIDVFAATQQDSTVVFNACVEPGTPLLIMGDPTRIKQVIINLVGNAFKFTHEGEVNLDVRLVAAAASQEPPLLKFTVVDTGIGMSAQVQEQLFTAFTQADGSITRRYGGTGLGLAISRQLVELMGGAIGVDSQPGIGSTFWFTLPLQLPAEGAIIDSIARAPVLKGRRALVVDDHDTFCRTARIALESFGMDVAIAQTATHALERLHADADYDVLIIDRCLPDMDGLDLARELYRAAPGAPPVLLVSLGVDVLDDLLLRESGIAAHLIKPIPLTALHDAVARLFDRAAARRERHAEPQLGRLHVLVAEDNSTNQVVISSMLRKLGIAPVFADDGEQAVAAYTQSLAAERPFDVIFMDCEMPVLDGYAATRYIRRHEGKYPGRPPVRIIGLTAHALPEYRERALAAGMQDFLTKPVRLESLRGVLGQIAAA